MRRSWCAVLTLPLLSSCAAWFLSGEHLVSRARPVALVETTGGVELAATTEFGVLLLGRTATEGACRVHYFLGDVPLIEDGELVGTGSAFTRAEIDLKTMSLRAFDRALPDDAVLEAMWTPDGTSVRSVALRLAHAPGIQGDLLADPGEDLPAGSTVLVRVADGRWQFAGLIAGRATLQADANGSEARYYVFAGVDRVRELLAQPEKHPVDKVPKYRVDDISVLKPVD